MLKIKRVLLGSLKKGSDLYDSLLDIIKKENIRCGAVFVIGALDKLKVGYFELDKKEYKSIYKEGLFELTSGMGNITVNEDGSIVLHLHIVAQNSNGDTYSGHLLTGNRVGITAEYVIFEFDGEVVRKVDKETGLNLIP